MRQTGTRRRPHGLTRLLFRLPIQLYRCHLGWLLGGRFVLIHHVGRRSGKPRRVVVEVVSHDRDPESWTVASGFGPTADWYLNLLVGPDTTIQVGRRTVPVTAVQLTPHDGARTVEAYAVAHPATARRLAGFMGFEVDGSAQDYRELGRNLPFVRLTRRTGASATG
jgi:deazaflavin-dependent oxidoreductase (nitroreductase family)